MATLSSLDTTHVTTASAAGNRKYRILCDVDVTTALKGGRGTTADRVRYGVNGEGATT